MKNLLLTQAALVALRLRKARLGLASTWILQGEAQVLVVRPRIVHRRGGARPDPRDDGRIRSLHGLWPEAPDRRARKEGPTRG